MFLQKSEEPGSSASVIYPWVVEGRHCACEQMAQRIAEWRPGVYVRVHGNVSDFDDNWRILAYNIRTITDFNEVGPLLLHCCHDRAKVMLCIVP